MSEIPTFGPKCLVCGYGACLLVDTGVDCDALVVPESTLRKEKK